KTDISEELARLRAHLAQLGVLLGDGGAVGRTLDFLIQEMNREANTVASKADDLEISQAVIAVKSILEKLREQTQNVEGDRSAEASRIQHGSGEETGNADRGLGPRRGWQDDALPRGPRAGARCLQFR